jgi:23S rRNA (cytosine1962-C5)-methyltransferase
MKPTRWRLKKSADRRFRSGHPWVYSNELAESPKGLEPGEAVELQDAGGKFLARGYGNPSSLIAFRALSRDPDEEILSPAFFERKLRACAQLRTVLGLSRVSHRLCFGEADGIPGLVIDRYLLAGGTHQVFVIQAHTAGMDRATPQILEALGALMRDGKGVSWGNTAIVMRNDVGVRKLEGLAEAESRIAREGGLSREALSKARIRVSAAVPGEEIEFAVDLLEGQKTGFFLDQSLNVQIAAWLFGELPRAQGLKSLKILDLCCYVGQWSTKLSRVFKEQGVDAQVTAVDASVRALELARANIEAQGARCETFKGDVLRDLGSIADSSFDLVICDPPALIKGRKDIPQGTHAYLQLNTQALRITRPGGAIISSSCSALFEESSFSQTLSKAAHRAGKRVQWVARGSQGPDHPVLAEFPEGRYLKAFFGVTS